MDINVKVAVRCRALSNEELERKSQIVVDTTSSPRLQLKSTDPSDREDKSFTFDHVFDAKTTQLQVYETLARPLLVQALEGFNGTILAYGQTGGGKTYSMIGNQGNDRGLIPRFNEELWTNVRKLENAHDYQYLITVSYLEIYNENVKDLLNPTDKPLQIREHPNEGIYVEGLCELIVEDVEDINRLLEQGNSVRELNGNKITNYNSGAHVIFTLKMERKLIETPSSGKMSKVHFVDLAGSERQPTTTPHLKEAANVNKSLIALRNVINALNRIS